MNYPTRPQGLNSWQILGNLATQGGQIAGQFSEAQNAEEDRRNRLAALMRDMADKKATAEMLKVKAARETAEEARKAAESERMKTAVTNFQTFAKGEEKVSQPARSIPYLAPGLGPNGEAAMEIPAVMQTVRPDRAAMQQRALETGAYADPGVKAYMDDTNPARTLEGQKEIFGIKDAAQAKRDEAKQQYSMALEKYRQGEMDYRTLMTLKAAAEKAANPAEKDLQPAEIDKLSTLGNKRDNVHYIVDNFKDSFSGPGTWTQNAFGKVTGTKEDQVLWWQGYSSFVNEIRHSTFGASLTPGEKSEFEKTIVTEAMSPSIAKKNLARQKQIVDQAVERQRRIHTAGRRVNNAQVEAALGPTVPEPAAQAGGSAWDQTKEQRYQELLKKRGGK